MAVALLIVLPLTALVTLPVYAQKDAVCDGVELAGGECNGAGTAENDVNNIITIAINIFSGVIGIAAVMMILYAGFKYVTAGGDSSKIQSAQHSIIYAIVGLIVVALAQIVVRFVLSQATG